MPVWANSAYDSEQNSRAKFDNDKLRKLVSDELRRYGLLIRHEVRPKSGGWRTTPGWILYGQLQGKAMQGLAPGWPSREVLHKGSFKDCCIKAAELLDALDASQNPDPLPGPPSGNPTR